MIANRVPVIDQGFRFKNGPDEEYTLIPALDKTAPERFGTVGSSAEQCRNGKSKKLRQRWVCPLWTRRHSTAEGIDMLANVVRAWEMGECHVCRHSGSTAMDACDAAVSASPARWK